MKKLAIISILIFVAACTSQELPPSPPPPGGAVGIGRAIVGMAGAMPTWAAPAKNTAVTPEEAYYGDGVVVSVSGFDYVYKNGYFFNSQIRSWEKFELQGEQTQDWLSGQAVGSVFIEASKFQTGDSYLVLYACTKVGASWDCNGSKWMLVTFTVLGSPTGEIPEMININQLVINAGIDPFAIQATTAEYDNFADINVVRYDARYREPGGLVVLVHVFDFNERSEIDETMNTLFRDIIINGLQVHDGHNVAVFLDENDKRVAVWTSGKEIVYIETHQASSANREIIEGYLQKYPSDLQPLT